MADPEVQKIMSDPGFAHVLNDCGQPGKFTRHMQDPRCVLPPRLTDPTHTWTGTTAL